MIIDMAAWKHAHRKPAPNLLAQTAEVSELWCALIAAWWLAAAQIWKDAK